MTVTTTSPTPIRKTTVGIRRLLGSGTYHFTGGFNTSGDEVQLNQVVDVSTGACSTAIATGSAFYDLSAYFSTYREQTDASIVRARFLNSSGVEIGSAETGGADFVAAQPSNNGQIDWGQDLAIGLIPTGTTSVDIEIVSDGGATNFDGYVDLVNFLVTTSPTLPALDIVVDRGCGNDLVAKSNRQPCQHFGVFHSFRRRSIGSQQRIMEVCSGQLTTPIVAVPSIPTTSGLN